MRAARAKRLPVAAGPPRFGSEHRSTLAMYAQALWPNAPARCPNEETPEQEAEAQPRLVMLDHS
jgi:hypothetical protein